MSTLQIGDEFYNHQLGLVTIYDIESAHTIVVLNQDGNYFRISGLSLRMEDK